jgi:hypothetical protein
MKWIFEDRLLYFEIVGSLAVVPVIYMVLLLKGRRARSSGGPGP